MVSPSLACGHWLHLGEDVTCLDEGGADFFHIDIMDGHYVPNLCLNFDIVREVRACSSTPMDLHLMTTNPQDYLELIARHKIELACAHPDSTSNFGGFVQALHDAGVKAGAALAPDQPLDLIMPYIDKLDYVLLLFVRPGFSGQKFRPEVLGKMRELDRIRQERDLKLVIEADGGLDWENVADVRAAGADMQVAGVFNVYDGGDIASNCRKLAQLTMPKHANRFTGHLQEEHK